MTTAEQTPTADYRFKAEVKQLLQILVHSLYKEQDIFLRELISNASDAMTRLHFEMLTNRDVLDPDAELAIHIEVPEVGEDEPKKIIIKDSGIGMTKDELITNLGTIAQSGAREFLEQVSENKDVDPSDVIGQFGVGFYSVFMVADEVRVVSRSYKKRAKAAAWVSDGSDEFRIEPAEKEDRGTEMHITLKKDAADLASEWKLKQIIKKHSDFVRYPIYVGEEQVNQQTPLWRKRPSEIETEDYTNFYRQMTMDFEEPLLTVHFSSDAPVNVRALLFIPAKREKGILTTRKDPGVMLYSHNVLIQEYCTDLLPKWLEFVDGVVDSEDLPLNVSRETVQNNRLMRQLGKMIKGRVLRELKKLADEDPEKYAKFWGEYGRYFKEGTAIDPTAKEDVLPFFRYHTSKSNGELTSLDAYLERKPDTQTDIYYVTGDSVSSVANSPHLDPFKERDLEVLYWVDPLDVLIAPGLMEYKETPFKNIDDADIELPETEDEAKEEASEAPLPEKAFNQFVGRCVTALGDKVIEVRASKVLKNSPVRLVAPADAQNNGMDRIQRLLNQDYEIPKRIMEVNRSHPLVAHLAHLVENDPDNALINLGIEQLYDSALIQEGLHPNPADILPRIQQLLTLAAAQADKS
ncbi:MAG: molecular chaperone HtpG [Ardenticatenaceae bacterium]|nr:molecular chaperone HtpG [Anaerolineales bacterium]MCB8937446.1 molecular chaperone HtpG [Ardenticatenaceae bacterium]MCB8975573.1 molecular chaperone HtpG [Ardenticatenaceae bacterium]